MSVVSQLFVMLIVLAFVAVIVASPQSTAAINAIGQLVQSLASNVAGSPQQQSS